MQKGVDYIGVGVGAVIRDASGRFFLALRGKDARNEKGKWEFPGGSVKFGETLAGAIIREVREEFGFSISVDRLLDVVDHLIPEEGQHWISPTFLCSYQNGEPRILEPDKCDRIGWFLFSDIPLNNLTIASKESLKNLRSYLSEKRD